MSGFVFGVETLGTQGTRDVIHTQTYRKARASFHSPNLGSGVITGPLKRDWLAPLVSQSCTRVGNILRTRAREIKPPGSCPRCRLGNLQKQFEVSANRQGAPDYYWTCLQCGYEGDGEVAVVESIQPIKSRARTA